MTTPLLRVENLSIAFKGVRDETLAVSRASFSLEQGKTLAIVGESGSGKSVTSLAIMGLLPHPQAFHPEGEIFFEGKPLLGMSSNDRRALRGRRMAMIFQEPMTALNPLHTIEKQIGEALDLHFQLKKDALRARILSLLELVGFENPAARLGAFPHELSGGQRQRVMIAMALAGEPDLLIADEPTTALDVTIQAQILALLKDLQKRLKLTLLLISHDLGIVRHMADHVVVMEKGQVVENAPVETLFASPQHPYTQRLLGAEPEGPPARIIQDSPQVVSCQNLSVSFPIYGGILRRVKSHVHAVESASFELRAGHTLGIVGESGSGKTTLAMALLRLQASVGALTFDGQDLHALSNKDMRRLRPHMQIVFQDPFSSLSPRMSIAQIVGEGLAYHGLTKTREDLNARIEEALLKVGLDREVMERYPHEFSGGQRQRIALARAIVLKPKLLILDEPTSALDRILQKEVLQLLKKLQEEEHMAYVFISHDLKVVRAIAHEVLVMKSGRIVERGTASDVFEQPRDPYTQSLLAASLDWRRA
ncbi:MAG: microcin ABC transporter ATP-binding protein [Candidatus Puniceispirillum sp.]|nr:microcin ABC transporter ATP-binding protein [Candidatus Puniceispirillum sp.]